jgi:hypothetical protein
MSESLPHHDHFELTNQEIEEEKEQPGVSADKEDLIRKRIGILRDSIITVMRGGGVEVDPKVAALVAEDEEVRQKFVEDLDTLPEERTFNFRELYAQKIEQVKAAQSGIDSLDESVQG